MSIKENNRFIDEFLGDAKEGTIFFDRKNREREFIKIGTYSSGEKYALFKPPTKNYLFQLSASQLKNWR